MNHALHKPPTVTAKDVGLAGCRVCGQVNTASDASCKRCGQRVHIRTPYSLQRLWAWWLAGLMLYIPANLYPILITKTFGSSEGSTIIGGVITLIEYGEHPIAAIVGFASVFVPMAKFIVVGLIGLHASHKIRLESHTAHKLHHIVEFIGRWSMIDVFVVAILSALVQFGFLASIEPGAAAACFALSVAFTMLSAQALDPRLIWDVEQKDKSHG